MADEFGRDSGNGRPGGDAGDAAGGEEGEVEGLTFWSKDAVACEIECVKMGAVGDGVVKLLEHWGKIGS